MKTLWALIVSLFACPDSYCTGAVKIQIERKQKMKINYIDYNFRKAGLAFIEKANEIIDEYLAAGYAMTIRQLYYQFVARDLLPNRLQSYSKLVAIISKGRLAGLVDWDAIEDRTRAPKRNSHWDSPSDIIKACADSYRIDTRATQKNYVEIWVEKEALAGVVERTTRVLDVFSFACRGYVSQTAMWEASKRFINEERNGKTTFILHLGDHDPSGIDMTRDIQDRLAAFGSNVFVDRIALNREQISEFNPPPNPAKNTDVRFAAYMEKHGSQSWELDALEPSVLDGLIREGVEALTDDGARHKLLNQQECERERLQEVADDWVN